MCEQSAPAPAPGNRWIWTGTWSKQAICGFLIVSVWMSFLPAPLVASDEQSVTGSIAYLRKHDVKISATASPEELAKALKPLLVDSETLAQTRQYLADLRVDDYAKREVASRELAKLRVPIDSLLAIPKSEPESGDLEFTWRLQQILAVRRNLALEDQLLHALIVIAEKRVPGLISELLSTAAALEGGDGRIQEAAERAIGATVSPADSKVLRSLRDPTLPAATRQRATVALARILATTSDPSVQELFADANRELQLAAVRGTMLAGSTVGVPALVDLLDDSSPAVRCQAAALLYQSTGEDFGYAGYDIPANRAKSVARWNSWLAEGALPEVLAPRTADLNGRVLVGIQLEEKPQAPERGRRRAKPALRSNVLEFTPSGSIRWRMQSSDLRGGTPVAAIPLRGGARAIAFGKQGESIQMNFTVRFFDPNSQPLGSLNGLAGIPVLATSDAGNLLAGAANEIVEVGLIGTVLNRTSFGTGNEPVDFFARVRGARMLVVSSQAGMVREFSSNGELLWERGNLHNPVYARRLENGGLVIGLMRGESADTSTIVRYDANGKVVWKFSPAQDIGAMTAVAALSNGNALFGTSSGLYEVGSGGRITRTWINGPVSFIYAD